MIPLPPKPFVIVIAGASGSGKSLLVHELANRLDDATTLHFDDYSQHLQGTDDLSAWASVGADPEQLFIPLLASDLRKLLAGSTVTNPQTGSTTKPASFIIIEDPFGRARIDIGRFVDFVVLLDTPLEICLARCILRAFSSESIVLDSKQVLLETVSAEHKLALLDKFLFGPYFPSETYRAVNALVRPTADLILDGLHSIDHHVSEILSALPPLLAKEK